MNKFALSFFILLTTAGYLSAQKGGLMVKRSDNGLYLEHKVVAKESFYSVARLYNTHPIYIASFNKLDMGKGLLIDQKLRIPLTDTNFTQQGNSGTPVYYKVGDKEGLLTVSNKNNKVSLANLRLWNNIAADEVKEGTKLIIGFLQSKEMPSVTIAGNAPEDEPPVVKVEEKPVVKTEEKPVEKEEVTPVIKVEEKPVVKVEEKPVISEQGYFKLHFEQQIRTNPASKNETVTSGIFKTTSGWQNAKYYLLIDKVAPGSIVKITNPSNNKIIFAKVLGEMSGIRQNEGLNIRISDAAASALTIIGEDKFIVKVIY